MIKLLVELYVPIIEEKYDVFIPNNKSIKTVINLLGKAVNELSDNSYNNKLTTLLYNKKNGVPYDIKKRVSDTDIVNGSKLILF